MSGAHPAKTCLVDKDPPSKNRVVGLPGFPCTRTGSTSSQALQPYRESWTTDTATVSGILFWLNRDPIEESGGLNLYAFVRNSSIGKWDALGLVAGQFQFDGVRIAPVGPRAYANAPASLTENSCRCTRRLFTCKYRLRCELSVRASINVNPSTHRVWDDRYDELIGDVLAHEHRHIANHRAWYDAQKAWTAIREVDYDDQSTCEAMGLTVVRVTEERWRRHYQREIDHVGPNWP